VADLSSEKAALSEEVLSAQQALVTVKDLCDKLKSAAKAEAEESAAALASLRAKDAAELAAAKRDRDALLHEKEKLGKLLSRETARHKKISAKFSRGNQRLAKSRKRYDALATSKLGRLALAWWKIKDRLLGRKKRACGVKGKPVPTKAQKAVSVQLPGEAWSQQRENEKRFFTK